MYWECMQGQGSQKTRALLTGAGIFVAVLAATSGYSFAQSQRPGDISDQTALATPRLGLRGAAGIGLPQPLSPGDAALARRIFALQDAGSWAEAMREAGRLQSDLLLGPILADRYLSAGASAAELAVWLTRFGDQPEAPAIRGLLERMAPAATPVTADIAPTRRGRAAPAQARQLFVQNRDEDALAAASSPRADADALFAGGLAAVRLGHVAAAAGLFEAAHHAASASTLRAASAFWAGRVAQRSGDRGSFAAWMRRAAFEGETFYGLIARRALGPAPTCLAGQTIGNADLEALLETPQGRRAFALLQVGEKRLAEAELRALWVATAQDGLFDRSIVLTARAVGFVQLAADIEQNDTARPDGASLSRLRPANGFVVDPALVYGLVRHESNFRPEAVSRNGARGLMQVMPTTAYAVAGSQAAQLHDPAVNLTIGQKYLLALAEDDVIDGDLIRILAGYNQGQGALRKWVDAVRDDGDPLMFVEAIPNAGIRSFVQTVLVHSWNYAAALRLPAAALDALAAGRYPTLVRAGAAKQQTAERTCARQ